MILCYQYFYLVRLIKNVIKHLNLISKKDEKDLSKYQQTTRKFTEVFNVPKKVNVSDQINLKQIKHYDGIDLSNETFDFEMLRQMLNHHFISNEIIDKEAKNLIIQLATLYGITEDGMKNVILSSITSAQQLSFEEMRKKARTYYLIEHDNQLPKLEHQTNKINDEKKIDKRKIQQMIGYNC